jgi:hypothetical protein
MPPDRHDPSRSDDSERSPMDPLLRPGSGDAIGDMGGYALSDSAEVLLISRAGRAGDPRSAVLV